MSGSKGSPPPEGQEPLPSKATEKAMVRALARLLFEQEQEAKEEEDRRRVGK